MIKLHGSLNEVVNVLSHISRIPKLQTSGEEEIEVEVVDDPMAFELLSLKNVPLVVTLTLIGDQLVVDATQVEESCSSAQLVMSVKQDGEVCSISKSKSEGILRTTLIGGIEVSKYHTFKCLFLFTD